LVGKSVGKRPLGRPRRRWEDNIRMELREMWWESVDWIHVAHDRDQWRVLLNVTWEARLNALLDSSVQSCECNYAQSHLQVTRRGRNSPRNVWFEVYSCLWWSAGVAADKTPDSHQSQCYRPLITHLHRYYFLFPQIITFWFPIVFPPHNTLEQQVSYESLWGCVLFNPYG
jgi:hypothetical protein